MTTTPRKLTPRQQAALAALQEARRENESQEAHEWRSVSELGPDIRMDTLYSLVNRGLAEYRYPPGSLVDARRTEWRLL